MHNHKSSTASAVPIIDFWNAGIHFRLTSAALKLRSFVTAVLHRCPGCFAGCQNADAPDSADGAAASRGDPCALAKLW